MIKFLAKVGIERASNKAGQGKWGLCKVGFNQLTSWVAQGFAVTAAFWSVRTETNREECLAQWLLLVRSVEYKLSLTNWAV